MQITINGVHENISKEELSIADLLAIREVESPEMVSVQLNGVIIDRADYGETAVADRDQVELLYFMGGGSNG